jgi:hypothetical protein
MGLLKKEIDACGIPDWHLVNKEETIKAFNSQASSVTPAIINNTKL